MLKKFISLCLVVASAALVSCGGSGNTITGPGGGGGNGPTVAAVTLLAATPQLQSDQSGSNTVALTAQVKDVNNAVLKDIPVTFSATSGSLAVTQFMTDATGLALAQLSNGTNPANRVITVTATAGLVSGSVNVTVVGTTLSVTGPASLASGDTGSYVLLAKDSKGAGIAGTTVALTSATGNTIAAPSLTTDGSGNVPFTVTASAAGNDTITASGLGLTTTKAIAISGDVLTFTVPVTGTEVVLGNAQALTVRWTKNGVPQVGQAITFSSTRGTLSAASALTNGSGDATVSITATTAGPAVLTATNPESTTTTRTIEFIATTPATVELQASPLTVGAGEQSELTALVRDAANNLVKNKVVQFLIESDITGGSLSVGSDTTDSQGRAKSVYTGGTVPSAADGVLIRATVQGTAVTDTVNVTVARQELFLTLGTGNDIFEIGTATYAKEWVILVTDVEGNAVANKTVQASIRSREYAKGFLTYQDPRWNYAAPSPVWCPDEDANLNGILDLVNGVPGTGEDFNGNNQIEAGNVALVAAVPESAPLGNPCATAGSTGTAANVVTNSQGRARVCVFYPQNFAMWVKARLTAKASVTGGSEFSESSLFVLEVSADDVANENVAPPNQFSPFGSDNGPGMPLTGVPGTDCAVPPP
ncbi:MAG: Ig-like domain-containing protein [Gammaproteobacteria bacterium]